ncbi:MAG: hypothetical protein RH949_00795 [Coleofasciculus sp. A1-SPW-01]
MARLGAGGAGEAGRQNFYNPLPYCLRHTERSRGVAYCLLPDQ